MTPAEFLAETKWMGVPLAAVLQAIPRPGRPVCVLRQKRKALGLSQAEVAQVVGLSFKTYSAIETGRHLTSLSVALALAWFFGCKVEDLWVVKP